MKFGFDLIKNNKQIAIQGVHKHFRGDQNLEIHAYIILERSLKSWYCVQLSTRVITDINTQIFPPEHLHNNNLITHHSGNKG